MVGSLYAYVVFGLPFLQGLDKDFNSLLVDRGLWNRRQFVLQPCQL